MKPSTLHCIFASLIAISPIAMAGEAPETLDSPGFGDPESVAFANRLWAALENAGLTGPDSMAGEPFLAGSEPHGRILEIFRGRLTVAGRQGDYRLKRSYDRPGAGESTVGEAPERYLSFYTVMFRRKPGYDPDNANWYWVKYKPDGSVAHRGTGGQSRAVAGRVSSRPDGSYGGCLYCHRSAGGGDYTFYPAQRFVQVPDSP